VLSEEVPQPHRLDAVENNDEPDASYKRNHEGAAQRTELLASIASARTFGRRQGIA